MTALRNTLGVLAVLVFIAASATMNAHFWLGQGKSDLEGQLLAAISVAGDLFKAMLPFYIAAAIANRRPVQATLGASVFLICLVFSLISALGFASSNRGAVAGGREALSARLSAIETELREVDSRISRMPAIEEIRVVEARIAVLKQDQRFSASRGCEEATAARTRELCAEFFREQADWAAATAGRLLGERQGELRRQVVQLKSQGAGQQADPQAHVLSKLFAFGDVSAVQTAIMVLIAVMVELIAACGLYLATGHGGDVRPRTVRAAAAPDNPAPVIDVPVRIEPQLALSRVVVGHPEPAGSDAPAVTRERPVRRTGRVSRATVDDAAVEPAAPERFSLGEAGALLKAQS